MGESQCRRDCALRNTRVSKGLIAYGESKLAVILWIRHMARLQPRVHFYSVHPGICRTNLFRHRQSWWLRLLLATPLAQSAATGAEGSTYLALADTRLLTRSVVAI